MSENPYLSTVEQADAADLSPLAPRAAWCAIASWMIVLLQGLCLLVAAAIARSGAREFGANIVLSVPLLGVVSVVTTLVSVVLAAKCWFRGELTRHFYVACVLALLHLGLVLFVTALFVAFGLSNM